MAAILSQPQCVDKGNFCQDKVQDLEYLTYMPHIVRTTPSAFNFNNQSSFVEGPGTENNMTTLFHWPLADASVICSHLNATEPIDDKLTHWPQGDWTTVSN